MIRPPLDELNLQYMKRPKVGGTIRDVGLNEDFLVPVGNESIIEIIDDSEEEIPLLSSELTQKTINSGVPSQRSQIVNENRTVEIRNTRESPTDTSGDSKSNNSIPTNVTHIKDKHENINKHRETTNTLSTTTLSTNTVSTNPSPEQAKDDPQDDILPLEIDHEEPPPKKLLKPKIRGKKLSDLLQTNVRVGLNKKYRIESLHKVKKLPGPK